MDKLTIRDLYKNTSTYSEKEVTLEGWIPCNFYYFNV